VANKLNPYCEQANRRNFHVWNINRAINLFSNTKEAQYDVNH